MALLRAILGSRRALAAAALVAVAIAWHPAGVRAQRGLEYEVKAGFVYNFIKFVEWPPQAMRDNEPFRLCTVGEDPFAGGLERVVAGDTAGGRPIVVEHLPADGSHAHCQIVFVPRSQSARAPAVIRGVGALPVLTVGESAGFLRGGGVVNLVVDSGKVRFDINRQAAEARRLRVSSKLLRVARSTNDALDREQR